MIDDALTKTDSSVKTLIRKYGPTGEATLDFFDEYGGWADDNDEKRRKRLDGSSRFTVISALGVRDAKAKLDERLGPQDEIRPLYLLGHGNADIQAVAPKFQVVLGNFGNFRRGGASGDAGLKVGLDAMGNPVCRTRNYSTTLDLPPTRKSSSADVIAEPVIYRNSSPTIQALSSRDGITNRLLALTDFRFVETSTVVGTIGGTDQIPGASRDPNVTVNPRTQLPRFDKNGPIALP